MNNLNKPSINNCLKVVICGCLYFLPLNSNAQLNTYGSNKRIAWYKGVLKQNQSIVKFLEYTLSLNTVPKMLRNLAVIESGLDGNAVSKASAAGIWQLMPQTALENGLFISKEQDERMDIYKSTHAAALILKKLYNKYQDWQLVIAAYNAGEGRIDKAIEKTGKKSFALIAGYLPAETVGHLNRFEEACMASGDYENYKRNTVDIAKTSRQNTELKIPIPNHTNVDIQGGYVLAIIAEEVRIGLNELKELNPAFEQDISKNGRTTLVLPIDKMPDFLINKTDILSRSLLVETK